MKSTSPMLALVFAATLLAPLPARAQIAVAPQAAWGDDLGLAVGGRVAFALPGLVIRVEPTVSLDWFVDCDGCSYYEVTPAVALSLTALGIGAYAGAGVNVARLTPDGAAGSDATENQIGGAFLLGVRAPFGLFGELRVTAGGAEQRVITVGFRFGG